ncbi:GvpL/GvpF family gas vesicle protein [Streptomyces sp. NA02950]|uniref:GvpL/GvpF family gas vesicle protein n=1 Tax=Streptomyces sp. NA02950 TaxID=2742137 RepID=UPI001590FD83|nr:GvpL/GvpF family gas vesicle protein [Streptomyces sp. NA02950]QKV95747.1 GvpL/GvpF family gas vesicle protein [Streptomyces sp. NA02950]
MNTYVYGIARGEVPDLGDRLRGIGDPPLPVRALTEGDLSAIVSDCPAELKPRRRDLLAHQQVLSEVGDAHPVLPMRFGSVSTSDDDVRTVLSEHADRYHDQLSRLADRVEYNVKAVHDENAVLHQVLSEEPELRMTAEANRASGGGTYEDRVRFGELVAGAVQAREVRDAQIVEEALTPTAEAVRPGPESGGWFLSLSLLLAKDGADPLLEAVAELEKAHPRLKLRVNGPLPPYSFVDS